MTSVFILLVPILEVVMSNVANVAISSGDLYQGLLGCDMLYRNNEALGLANIAFWLPPWSHKNLLQC